VVSVSGNAGISKPARRADGDEDRRIDLLGFGVGRGLGQNGGEAGEDLLKDRD